MSAATGTGTATIETLPAMIAIGAVGELGDRPFPDVLGELLGAVWATCETCGAVGVDAPYARYLRWDDEAKVIEGGQPIDPPSRDRVEAAAARAGQEAAPGVPHLVDVPGGPAAVLWHVGPYETLQATWERLWGWVGAKGLSAGGQAREEYWTDPGTAPPEEWRTRLVIPLDL